MKTKLLISFLLIFNCNLLSSQEIINNKGYVITTDTLIVTNAVFDYFRQMLDSTVFFVYSGCIINGDSISFTGKNDYMVKITNPQKGYLEIYFKGRLLYKYSLFKNEITGIGFCYYQFSDVVAMQGQFKNGLLDGLVFINNKDGETREVMMFKKGRYVRNIYIKYCFTKKCLRNFSRHRSDNPLRLDEVIVR